MQTWETIPEKGKFKVLKNSNSHGHKIGEIYEYDTSNIHLGSEYDCYGNTKGRIDYAGFYERSAAQITKEKPGYYLLLSDVEILNLKEKKDYFNKKLFKKL